MDLYNHYVATGYVYDRSTDRFLFVFQKNLEKWLPPGGHLNKGEMPHKGVLREVFEEIGVVGRVINLLEVPEIGKGTTIQIPSPFCILYEKIPAESEGEEHMHIDFVYVIEINPSSPLKLSEDEVSFAKWISSKQVDYLNTFENVKLVCRTISNFNKGYRI